jgi:hypothetical protein
VRAVHRPADRPRRARVLRRIEETEALTARNRSRLTLTFAFNYGD